MIEPPTLSTASLAPAIQDERAREYLRLTANVSLQIIQILNLQAPEVEQFKERLDRQRQDLAIAKTVIADGRPDGQEGVDRQQLKLEATLQALKIFDNSANILAGSILQIAQQGMSGVHTGITKYPNKGRKIAGVNLCDLVWQGRNQAMHYETTAKRADWKDVFLALGIAYPGAFSLTPPYKSYAKAIFDLLGWQSYSVYEKDLQTLLLGAHEPNSAAN